MVESVEISGNYTYIYSEKTIYKSSLYGIIKEEIKI